MDRREMIPGRKARIESELIPNDIRCVSFYYYLNETVDAQLNVYLHDPRSNMSQQLWSIDQSLGPMWILQEMTVRPNITADPTEKFTIIYEAVVGTRIGGKNLKKRHATSTNVHSRFGDR